MKGTRFYEDAPIEDIYRWWGAEAAGSSPAWERVCNQVATTAELQALLESLPGAKRQPNLFLGALRYLGGPQEAGDDLLAWVLGHWPDIRHTILTRHTQTNEVGRCAVLAPVLASLPQPIALIEVGMSAGLCLFHDLYRYRWSVDGHVTTAGSGDVLVECRVSGGGLPLAVPAIAWRGGSDRNPLDPADSDDARWLQALVWPGESARERRLDAALAVAADQPVHRVTGDVTATLPDLVAAVPAGLTTVVVHSAVLAYLDRHARERHIALLKDLGVRWVTNEGMRVVAEVRHRLPRGFEDDSRPCFVLALDGQPLARVGSHGQWLEWL